MHIHSGQGRVTPMDVACRPHGGRTHQARLEVENAELRKSEVWHRSLIDLGGTVYITIDARGKITYASSSLTQCLGWTPQECVGKTPSDFLHPQDHPLLAKRLGQLLANPGTTMNARGRCRHKDGPWRVVEIVGSNLLNEPLVAGVVVALYDVTERARAERELRESEERFRAIFEQAAVGIAQVGLDGRWLRFNERLCEITGYSREELPRKTFYEITHPDDVSIDRRDVSRLLAGEADHCLSEKRCVRPDGSLAWVHLTRSVMRGPDGQPEHFIVVAQDISERKRLEAALQESEAKRARIERTAASGQLAARIAHEINNPLGGIMNSFRLVRSAVPPDHPYGEFAEIIDKELRRIADIVRQMYRLYRPSPEAMRTLRMAEVVGDIVTMLAPDWRQKKLMVDRHLEVPKSLPGIPQPPVLQVLYNIIKNAIEVSPVGGRVTITARMLPGGVEIAVGDEGPGIPSKLQERVFEPFFSTKDEGGAEGLGLGLWISQGIAEALHGTLRFESPPGQGTIFRLFLPCSAAA